MYYDLGGTYSKTHFYLNKYFSNCNSSYPIITKYRKTENYIETESLGNVQEHEFHAYNLKEDFIYLDLAFQLLKSVIHTFP